MGERLALPPCAGPATRDTCAFGGVLGAAMVASSRSKLARFPPRLAGVAEVPVHVAAERCPDWLSLGAAGCTVFLSTIDGQVASAFLFVAGAQQPVIDAALAEKYGRPPLLDPQSPCDSDLAKVRIWPMDGLGALYDPATRCDTTKGGGVVQVITPTYASRVKAASAKVPRSQPRM